MSVSIVSGLIKGLAKCHIRRIVNVTPIRTLSEELERKQIVEKPTPYERPKQLCIACKNKINFDYKNPRLLSQFISPLNGFIYDKHITGLCELQQTNLEREIKKSRLAKLMPVHYKDPAYNKDPLICDPQKLKRPNPF